MTKACSQRRKSFTRSDAICSPYIDQYGSQTSIDIIDYVHNNKKEKITVIVNLLSDEMLSNHHHETNAHSAGKINDGNVNVNDDLSTVGGSCGAAAVQPTNNTTTTEAVSEAEPKAKNSNHRKKNEIDPHTIGIINSTSRKGN